MERIGYERYIYVWYKKRYTQTPDIILLQSVYNNLTDEYVDEIIKANTHIEKWESAYVVKYIA